MCGFKLTFKEKKGTNQSGTTDRGTFQETKEERDEERRRCDR